jgi:hypothetical protein
VEMVEGGCLRGGEEREGGSQVCVGRKGAAKKAKRGKRPPPTVSLREKRNDATDDSDLASNSPQPFFPHPCIKDHPLATFFGSFVFYRSCCSY